jgi:hypothetical protein
MIDFKYKSVDDEQGEANGIGVMAKGVGQQYTRVRSRSTHFAQRSTDV